MKSPDDVDCHGQLLAVGVLGLVEAMESIEE